MSLILASGSPRRKELLTLAGFSYTVCPADIAEILPEAISVEDSAAELARQKALAVAQKYPKDIILAADTVVIAENTLLGKPKDKADARRMLSLLSGKTHHVNTGCCILIPGKAPIINTEISYVTFYPLSEEEIEQYIATGEPMDKAGAYGIQGKGGLLVQKIEGDYYNIVGLPISKISRILAPFLPK